MATELMSTHQPCRTLFGNGKAELLHFFYENRLTAKAFSRIRHWSANHALFYILLLLRRSSCHVVFRLQ